MNIRFNRIILTLAMLHPFVLLPLGDILFPNLLIDSYRTGFLFPLLFCMFAYLGFEVIFFMTWIFDGKPEAIEIIKFPFKEIKKFYTQNKAVV